MRKGRCLLGLFSPLNFVFILLLIFNFPHRSWSTVVKKASLSSLVSQAQIIVHVRVGESWSPKTRGKQGEIYTYTRLLPISTWAGQVTSDELLLVQLGGQTGEFRMEVHGDAKLKTDDEVLLFLSTARKTLPVPSDKILKAVQVVNLVSLAQGAFFVQSPSQAAGDLRPLKQNLDGLVFYTAHQKELSLKANSHQSTPQKLWTLKSLKQEIVRFKKGSTQ